MTRPELPPVETWCQDWRARFNANESALYSDPANVQLLMDQSKLRYELLEAIAAYPEKDTRIVLDLTRQIMGY
jgi:hypothetical protein